MRQLILPAAAVLLLAGCNSETKVASSGATTESPEKDILFTNRDTTVSPAQDFFLYANGGLDQPQPDTR